MDFVSCVRSVSVIGKHDTPLDSELTDLRRMAGSVTWEREYFRLAGVMLACRLAQMQGAKDPVWHFLGEMDYAAEMGKVLQEALQRRRLDFPT